MSRETKIYLVVLAVVLLTLIVFYKSRVGMCQQFVDFGPWVRRVEIECPVGVRP